MDTGTKRTRQSLPEPWSENAIGSRIRQVRKLYGMTLAEVSAATGLSVSALSKIENDQISPTFSSLMRLVEGLGLSLGDLVSLDSHDRSTEARMTVTRAGDARFRSTPSYDIWPLCGDIQHKRMTPMVERVRNRDPNSGDGLLSHSGEEFVYVLRGEIEVHTQHYEPVRLGVGDSIYLDSRMAHTYTTASEDDAEILMIWLSPPAQSSRDNLEMAEALLARKV